MSMLQYIFIYSLPRCSRPVLNLNHSWSLSWYAEVTYQWGFSGSAWHMPTSGAEHKHGWVLELILRQIPGGIYFHSLLGEKDDLNVSTSYWYLSLSPQYTLWSFIQSNIHSLKIDNCCWSASWCLCSMYRMLGFNSIVHAWCYLGNPVCFWHGYFPWLMCLCSVHEKAEVPKTINDWTG